MRLCSAYTVIFVLFAGRYGFSREVEKVFEVTEGRNITVACPMYIYGNIKIFCKTDCSEEENILVQTTDFQHHKGRFSITHESMGLLSLQMSVIITNLHRSDTGYYQCGLDYGQRNATMVEFGIVVYRAFTTSLYNSSENYTTLTSTTSSPSDHEQQQTPTQTPTTTTGVITYLVLMAVFLLLFLVLFILCWKKEKTNPKVNDETNTHANEEDREYVNLRPAPVSKTADDTYQSLCVDTMDPNQIYSSI
ncbi:hypothetical protein WMY93_030681 [Mugilogobius chulae]|uniref:Immunoglobulin V-set domain-containing protein n=1 Tax=Mugilogobius chulae TaxID=88201 RepID=A0AAW0MRM7_9GOBI